MEIQGQSYSDWLQEVQNAGGEFAWIRANNFARCHNAGRLPEEISAGIFRSRRLQETISDVAAKRVTAETLVRAEAQQILSNMAHDMHLHTAVQPIGYTLAKTFARLFSRIWVNMGQLEQVRQMAGDRGTSAVPLVWLPTHKSYVDFLLISLLSYHQRIQLPAICAGEDFQSSKVLGEALRRCGAFFIRRSFKEDPLYWAIFAEYVQQHLVHADRPVEFFLEGQRSRTGKSVFPRTGLLQLVLEPFLRGQLYDTLLVPITINYDRILEEQLFAFELLGHAKPRETTSGLLKARQILAQSFGDIFVTVGQPISLRQHFLSSSRGTTSADLRMDLLLLSMPENQNHLDARIGVEAHELALELVGRQNRQNVLSVWPFMASALLEILNSKKEKTPKIPLEMLTGKVHSLTRVFAKCLPGSQIRRVGVNVEEDIRHFLRLHGQHLHFDERTNIVEPTVLPSAETDELSFLPLLPNAVLLANYSSLLVSMLAPFCILATVLLSSSSDKKPDLPCSSAADVQFEQFVFLRTLFSREFVHESRRDQSVFEEAKQILGKFACADVEELRQLLMPFLVGYHCIVGIFMDSVGHQPLGQAELLKGTQRRLMEMIQQRNGKTLMGLQMVSSDLIKNSFQSLKASQIVQFDQAKCVQMDMSEAYKIWKRLGRFAGPSLSREETFLSPITAKSRL